ncbi:MAG: hypothetical protein ACRDSZ_14490 [Pseudonocardiaceae bacterium]
MVEQWRNRGGGSHNIDVILHNHGASPRTEHISGQLSGDQPPRLFGRSRALHEHGWLGEHHDTSITGNTQLQVSQVVAHLVAVEATTVEVRRPQNRHSVGSRFGVEVAAATIPHQRSR